MRALIFLGVILVDAVVTKICTWKIEDFLTVLVNGCFMFIEVSVLKLAVYSCSSFIISKMVKSIHFVVLTMETVSH